MTHLSIIDSTLFELVDIETIEEHPCLQNMHDITVEDEETFVFADGIISHNSAAGVGIETRNPLYHGFYALRGKVLNTFGMTSYEILKNKELNELTSIIGLDINDPELYDDPEELYELTIDDTTYIVGRDDSFTHKGTVYSVAEFIK